MLEKIKDPGSAITHFIGMLMAMFAATPLIIKSLHEPDYIHVISLTVFIVSMILLYAASTIYHTLNLSEKTNRILRKLDHSMIFVLIAGSYTPICLIVLKGPVGYFLFALVWAIALIGIIVKICWITCPNGFLLCFISAGLGLRTGFHTDCQFALSGSFWMAPGRRYHLHCRRHHLCFESSAVRCKAQKFRLT